MPPTITYGILSFNRKVQLDNLLAQLSQTKVADSEVLVVDNGSSDGTDQLVSKYSSTNIKFVMNSTNKGVSAGWNDIFKASTGKLVFIFNDDYAITAPGWEQLYVDTMNKQLSIMSFPRSMGSYGSEVYNNWVVEGNRRYCHNFRLFGIPREVHNAVGGFDERFQYGYEDTALNLSAFKLGYPLLEMNTAIVHIQHLKDTATSGTPKSKWDIEKDQIHSRNFSKNSELFYKLWPQGV